MWRAADQHLLSLVVVVVVVVVVGLAGCGSTPSESAAPAVEQPAQITEGTPPVPPTDQSPPDAEQSTGTPDESSTPEQEPAEQTAPPAGQGTLSDTPAYEEQFSRASEQWPDPAAIADGVYVLAAGQSASIPYEVPGSALGALTEVGVVMADGGGTALTCDLGESGAIVLDLRADGGYSVGQSLGGSTRELAVGTLPEGQRGEPGELTALRLLCADGPDGLAVAVSLHGAALSFVEGATGEVPAGGPTWTVTTTGSTPSRIDTVLLSLVEV